MDCQVAQNPTLKKESSMEKFVVGTRFFESKAENAEASLRKLRAFVLGALASGAEKVYVAVNVAEDKSGALNAPWGEKVVVFGVQPWGKFVMPLNAILLAARKELATGVGMLFASTEVVLNAKVVMSLMDHMDRKTYVVGAAMLGHDFQQGYHGPANGRMFPWNTLALWNPEYLYPIGFPLIGDGIPEDPSTAGVEELATGSALEDLRSSIAKLVTIEGVAWDTSSFDPERLAKHNAKMASKVTRPAEQLEWAQLSEPTVIHI
ncbi:hypothetical protein L6255_02095 [Candidatus Parcubacteria bacterium]|nr:hypothetical protein [Patescibacteria group bacterium]MCG2689207.1 hypothetical protein [Candidatus Parcubacteria bacterium]